MGWSCGGGRVKAGDCGWKKGEEECQQGAVYILFVRGWQLPTSHSLGWVRLRACIIAFASASTRQGALCFGQARTRQTGQSDRRIKHLFQGTEAVNQEKSITVN
jgi:hypothetical protein